MKPIVASTLSVILFVAGLALLAVWPLAQPFTASGPQSSFGNLTTGSPPSGTEYDLIGPILMAAAIAYAFVAYTIRS
jgi:hypothetical protein